MNLNCPHCQQNIEADEQLAGNSIECPSCSHVFVLPRTTAGAAPPRAPSAIGSEKPRRKRRKLFSGELFFWLVFAAGTGGFGYAMHEWHTTPQETLRRIVSNAQQFVEGPAKPEPTPEVIEAESSTPRPAKLKLAPRPDPLIWLVDHKQWWPKEVILREPQEFPAVSGGRNVGSLTVPAGSVVTIAEITKTDLNADFMGGTRRVPIAATDLASRAEAALRKAEAEGALAENAPARPTFPDIPEMDEKEAPAADARDASADEINRGLGAIYTRGATTFRVFAPTAKTASVVLYDHSSGNEGRNVQPLRQELNGFWDGTVRGDLQGRFYTILLDPTDPQHAREVLDPYATNAVASSRRGRITPLTTPVASGPGVASPVDAIIYEMHVRDFTIAPNSGVQHAGLYLGWTETGTKLPEDPQIRTALDHLVELGVTHAELMPVEDFENDEESRGFNWGYITSAFFSPEGMFASNPNNSSRVRELKALVQALHARGINVIMDVVYNHTAGNASLMSIAPEYYYRRGTNGALANGSGCGNEVKSESPMGRRLILDSLKYWAREYGIDGFRFDLMALIDQETMREADRELRAINPNIILFGEPWTGGTSPLATKTDKSNLRQVPVGAFNDDFRNALKGQPDGNEPGWIQNGSKANDLKAALLVSDWFAAPTQSINYMTCHDNLVLWDKLVASMPNADDKLRIETMKLGYLVLFTAQGVPFFHGGEEFARSKGGNNNSYEAPDSVNEVDWALKREHIDLFHYVRDLIALRKAHPMFRLRTRPDVRSRVQFLATPDQKTIMFTVNGSNLPNEIWKRACVVLNSADSADAEITLPSGEWNLAADANGAATTSQLISGKINVRAKSGVILFQR